VGNPCRFALIQLLPYHNPLLHGNPSRRLQVALAQPDGLAARAPVWISAYDWRQGLALPRGQGHPRNFVCPTLRICFKARIAWELIIQYIEDFRLLLEPSGSWMWSTIQRALA
jgi:hypothetical protein